MEKKRVSVRSSSQVPIQSTPTREELVTCVGIHVRQTGAQSVLTSQAVADRFGLHTTDLECLDLIYLRECLSAGELAKATGLTSGAVTALIDRLERAGYVNRHSDPEDRRRVLVRIRHDAIEPIKAVYTPMQARMFKLWRTFKNPELEIIIDFLARSTALAVACAEDLRRNTPGFSKSPGTRIQKTSQTTVSRGTRSGK